MRSLSQHEKVTAVHTHRRIHTRTHTHTHGSWTLATCLLENGKNGEDGKKGRGREREREKTMKNLSIEHSFIFSLWLFFMTKYWVCNPFDFCNVTFMSEAKNVG